MEADCSGYGVFDRFGLVRVDIYADHFIADACQAFGDGASQVS